MIDKYKYSKKELESLIINHDKYFGHLSSNGEIKELLIEHLLLVQKYFTELIYVHQLENVIENLVSGISKDESIKEFIKELFIKSIAIHDFGKVNPEFQSRKMKNPIQGFKHELSSGHSLISGYLYTMLSEKIAAKKNFNEEQETVIDFLCLSFSYPILKHHASNLKSIKNDLSYSENINDLLKFIPYFNGFDEESFISEINDFVFKNSTLIFENVDDFVNDRFAIFALLKLNYSLLTASDYLATTHFMNRWEKMETDFGVFDDELKKKIIKNIETTEDYNKRTYAELSDYKLEFPTERSNKNLNKLRQNLSVETITGIRNNLDKHLFYIEAPTGGGKTNLSMLALAEFLRNDLNKNENNITKAFYVFPFTTLITQTFKSLKETLGLEDEEIVQIHSKAGFSQKGSDDKYGKEKPNIIDYQFVNYPVALLSHIKFFDILKSNRKSANYLMHRLANSVVIIDELQSYSPKEWDKVIYFINKYAKYFNIKFILMSATLPKIDKLLSEEGKKESFEKEAFVDLNKHKDSYFQNPNFAERIQFDFSLLNNSEFDKNNRDDFLQKLWEKLKSESENYKAQSEDERVHTIIEFIFKKTASEFIRIAKQAESLFEEVFILSGTTLEPRRREIIAKLKSDKYKHKNVLLITTQVVEAGVDIDMDLGFKDTSLIDSDEQLAGRINRNVNKPSCKLYLFDCDDAKVIYGKDYRFNKVQHELKNQYREILETKKFDIVYDSVMKERAELNKSDDFINLKSYLTSIKHLDFNSVNDDFKLIDNNLIMTNLFVPVSIPVDIPGSSEKNFSKDELDFLKGKNKYADEPFVSGEKVWELYCEIIENRDTDFTKQKIQKVILQGLVSKFSFSVGTYSKEMKKIESSGYGIEKYGFYKIADADKIYDYKDGIKPLKFEDIRFI